MALNVGDVLKAYRSSQNGGDGVANVGETQDSGFASLLDNFMGDAVGTLKNSEKVSLAALHGKASINDVVSAVSAADVALQTIVTIRDKVVTAYKELMSAAV